MYCVRKVRNQEYYKVSVKKEYEKEYGGCDIFISDKEKAIDLMNYMNKDKPNYVHNLVDKIYDLNNNIITI
jgi:hypothetical protein